MMGLEPTTLLHGKPSGAVTPFRPVPRKRRLSRETANRELLDRYVERYNAGDLGAVMELYAEDAVQVMPDGTFEGWSAVRDRLVQELDGFTDLNERVCFEPRRPRQREPGPARPGHARARRPGRRRAHT